MLARLGLVVCVALTAGCTVPAGDAPLSSDRVTSKAAALQLAETGCPALRDETPGSHLEALFQKGNWLVVRKLSTNNAGCDWADGADVSASDGRVVCTACVTAN